MKELKDTKICTKCKTTKPTSEYFKMKSQKSGLDPKCRDCSKEAKRLSNQKVKALNPESWNDRRRKYVAKYKQKHPDRVKLSEKRTRLKLKFGITLEEYQFLLTLQGGGCAICQNSPTSKMLAVDHCHKTGRVRGLLCSNCNTAIGLLKDSISTLDSAIQYLKKHDS